MPRLITLLLLGFILSYPVFAQSVPANQGTATPSLPANNGPSILIKGKIKDTLENKTLSNASVLLLRQTDSILVQYTRTDKAGNFTLSHIPAGHYLFLVTYPAYADYADSLIIKDTADISLPPIALILKSKLLEEVVVNGSKGAIHIKGDTVEFRADSFHTQAGATVEDLLKKLPGIQVDRNGKITAQGEKVQKVLVDGEEFFGDDPTLVTQNLRADMVDKVQVFDKKSDQAAFTGIDDGQRSKTINLKLKNSKKNGYFGKVTAGAGTDGYYDEQVMLNLFKNKKKLALYGILSNTGKTGLNWQERDKYGQSFSGMADYDENTGNYSVNVPDNDLETWDGRYGGQGFPTVKTAGLHYNDKWDDDRQSLNGNYKVMQLGVNGSSSTSSQFILPDTLYYNKERQTFHNQILRHSIDGSYEVKFDSTSSVKIMADGGTDHKTTGSSYSSQALASDSSLVNQNTRTVSSLSDNRIVNSNIMWRKKLPKKGRTLSVNIRENYAQNTSLGFLNSATSFYSAGVFSHDSLIDQSKSYHTQNTLLDSKITYTEPLSKTSFLSANYGLSVNNSSSDRSSFNKSSDGKYTALDSLYSNNYQFNIFTQQGGLSYMLVKKKLRFSAGTNLGFTSFHQRDLLADTTGQRKFTNWYPQASFSYSFTNQRRMNLQYSGYTNQPTVQQLQPIRTNEDPLNITIGNPGLKPQFGNQVRLSFFDYKVLTDRSIWANISYGFTQNAISSRVDVGSSGQRVTQSINVNGNHNFNANIYYDFKWRAPDLHIGFFTELNQSRNVSVVNDLLNKTNSGNYQFGFNIYKTKEKKYEINVHAAATYTQSNSSINTGICTDYWSYNFGPAMDVFLPLKFQVHTDFDISLRQKTPVFTTNNNVVILNAWIGKKFLKNDALLIKAAGNDLLNQNIGFNRTVNSNFISENTYSTIKRYFMFSIVWNFTKAGTPAPTNGN
ncbi:MAG TPA: outer membrane beta-barrel protein [Puia sp.]|nr:outer membrane beta-barrel protein [Puia sp.]